MLLRHASFALLHCLRVAVSFPPGCNHETSSIVSRVAYHFPFRSTLLWKYLSRMGTQVHKSALLSRAYLCSSSLLFLLCHTYFVMQTFFVHYFWLCFSLTISCSPFVSYFDSSLFRIGLALTQAHPLNPLRHRGGTLLRRARP